jgi:transcriptional regulator with XRE-family HTH domain
VKRCIFCATQYFMENGTGINLKKLAAHLRTKRAGNALRDVAEEIGSVSASTLSRIEQENPPDLPTFIRLCRWLGASPDEFVEPAFGTKRMAGPNSQMYLPDSIEAQLRQHSGLPPASLSAISEMIRLAYRAAESDRDKPKSQN